MCLFALGSSQFDVFSKWSIWSRTSFVRHFCKVCIIYIPLLSCLLLGNNVKSSLPGGCPGWTLPRINTLWPRQNGRHFAQDIFKCIFLSENVWIPINISLKFVPKGQINDAPSLVQIMAWRRPGDKPLSEPVMVSLPTHICVTRLQWVNIWLFTELLQHISLWLIARL